MLGAYAPRAVEICLPCRSSEYWIVQHNFRTPSHPSTPSSGLSVRVCSIWRRSAVEHAPRNPGGAKQYLHSVRTVAFLYRFQSLASMRPRNEDLRLAVPTQFAMVSAPYTATPFAMVSAPTLRPRLRWYLRLTLRPRLRWYLRLHCDPVCDGICAYTAIRCAIIGASVRTSRTRHPHQPPPLLLLRNLA